jgi:hypothetical protein
MYKEWGRVCRAPRPPPRLLLASGAGVKAGVIVRENMTQNAFKNPARKVLQIFWQITRA